MAVLAKYTKDPQAVLDYTIDWSDWLVGGDTLVDASFTVPEGLTKDSESNTTTTATVWLSGGTAGRDYEVVCHVTTFGDREDDRTIRISCRQR